MLWRLSEVLDWYGATRGSPVDERLKAVAVVAMQLNTLAKPVKVSRQVEREFACCIMGASTPEPHLDRMVRRPPRAAASGRGPAH